MGLDPLRRLDAGEASLLKEDGSYRLVPNEDYYLEKLRELRKAYRYDSEVWHAEADELLLCALESFGWDKVVAEYKSAQKFFYYA